MSSVTLLLRVSLRSFGRMKMVSWQPSKKVGSTGQKTWPFVGFQGLRKNAGYCSGLKTRGSKSSLSQDKFAWQKSSRANPRRTWQWRGGPGYAAQVQVNGTKLLLSMGSQSKCRVEIIKWQVLPQRKNDQLLLDRMICDCWHFTFYYYSNILRGKCS